MRLFTSAIFVVSMICSWAVVDVLACKKNNMLIFKRTSPEGASGIWAGESSKNCKRIPPWMTMTVRDTARDVISTRTGHVVKLTGMYLKEINPVVKIIYANPENGIEMQAIYNQISNLRQVEQYVGGWLMPLTDTRVAVFIMMPNMGEALKDTPDDQKKYKEQKAAAIKNYRGKYNMNHQDDSISNYVQKPGEPLNLVGWGLGGYYDKPRNQKRISIFCPNKRLPLPPTPEPPRLSEIQAGATSCPPMENTILSHEHKLLWGNEEANYYKIDTDKPLALKVSWIVGNLELQTFKNEVSNTQMVDELESAGLLTINSKEAKYISYLIIRFPGEMEKDIPMEKRPNQDQKATFQQRAIARYRNDYNMINMRISDDYFIYNMKEERAYLYDWSRARHAKLPEATLTKICHPTKDNMDSIKGYPNAFMNVFKQTQRQPSA